MCVCLPTSQGTEGGGKLVRLKEGQELNVEIVVTAEDGTSSKSFSISFKRLSASDAILANLQVTPGALEPPFHPSVTEYHCYLQCKVDKLLLQAKPQDQAMKVVLPECAIASSQQDDSSVAAPLNPGHTQLKVSVCSANGANTRVYAIVAVKRALSYPVVLKLPVAAGKGGGAGLLGACANEFSCAVCCGIVHRPSRIIAGERNSSLPSSLVFCQPCLEELTRTNKMDIFTGKVLEGDWLELDFATDEKLASELAECCSPVGTIEAPLGQVGAKLAEQRAKKTEKEEVCVCKSFPNRPKDISVGFYSLINALNQPMNPRPCLCAQIAARRCQQLTHSFTRTCCAQLTSPSLHQSTR